ncbi:hypothetical protein STCU_04402 [Strigomonas culicis]|nr:hypothetical protein STCU_04402 [Strigomonas culicis]|eukprot:EPY29619.1 hypothetical protein STCU_04402 [Strigomonas culicis]
MANPSNYSAHALEIVAFRPDSVKERPGDMLAFPWHGNEGSLNGFKSVHGGTLSTLGDIFTQIHVKSASPQASIRSLSFEISFLSAVFAGKQCTCITRVVSERDNVVFTDFSFEDEASGELYARGTHVFSIQ